MPLRFWGFSLEGTANIIIVFINILFFYNYLEL
nr:MAG TPA: hypothetical protein [Caudoviricetes sp.]